MEPTPNHRKLTTPIADIRDARERMGDATYSDEGMVFEAADAYLALLDGHIVDGKKLVSVE